MPNCFTFIIHNGNTFTFKIKHQNHNLTEGDLITIEGSVDIGGISAFHINKTHMIKTVLNNN